MPAYRLRLVLVLLHVAAPLLAQNTFYVDGATGVDGPGHGTTAATPWRTLTYAMIHATATATNPATVRVQGGQTYAPATNGEAFPVTLRPHLALAGVVANGSRPRLAVPAGGTGLLLAPGTAYNNGAIVHRNLVVDGGTVGFDCGSNAGASHAAVLEDCEFRSQGTAGVRSSALGGANSLTLRRCILAGSGAAGGAAATLQAIYGNAAAQRLEVVGCTIRGWGRGVCFETGSLSTWTITTIVRATTVSQCSVGVAAQTPFAPMAGSGARSSTVTLESSSISDCSIGVRSELAPAFAGHSMIASDLSIARCGTGLAMSNYGYGQSNATWERGVVTACGTGVVVSARLYGQARLDLRQVDLLSNGGAVRGSSEGGDVWLTIERSRVLGGETGLSLSAWSSTDIAYLTVADCLLARQSAVAVDAYYARTSLDRCTIADSVVGVRGAFVASRVDRCLFSGNGGDAQVAAWPPNGIYFATCATDAAVPLPASASAPSFQFPAVGLGRPHYKLLPGSPVIDFANVGGVDYEGDARGIPATPGATAPGDLGADEYVPSGSLRRYGLPTYGAAKASPSIGSPSSSAVIGGGYVVNLSGAAEPGVTGPTIALLATGVTDTADQLPTELSLLGLPGCHLWLDPLDAPIMRPVTAAGAASVPISIPGRPALLGFVLAHQWLVGLPAGNGVVTSDALRVMVGQ